MHKLITLTFFTLLLFPNCKQEETAPDMVVGTITGPNLRLCTSICCSGWFIEIGENDYHFLYFPQGSDFNASSIESYPVEVQLNYEDSEDCWDNSIEILEIEAI